MCWWMLSQEHFWVTEAQWFAGAQHHSAVIARRRRAPLSMLTREEAQDECPAPAPAAPVGGAG